MSYDVPAMDELIAAALAEDLDVPPLWLLDGKSHAELVGRDVTSAVVVPADAEFAGVIVAREAGVVCGLPVAKRVWEMLAQACEAEREVSVEVFPLVAEGSYVDAGTEVAEIEGRALFVLAAERTALNMLMTLSGIATEARRWHEAAGQGPIVCDTRKTLPGMRALSKYAVRVGGACNHRAGLYDMVLVKDNHISFTGGIAAATEAARSGAPGLTVEVEADSAEQAEEAARAGADIVLLDNMDDATLARSVRAVREAAARTGRRVLTEASGGISFDRLAALRATGVDRISTSALTLAPPLDFGLDETHR